MVRARRKSNNNTRNAEDSARRRRTGMSNADSDTGVSSDADVRSNADGGSDTDVRNASANSDSDVREAAYNRSATDNRGIAAANDDPLICPNCGSRRAIRRNRQRFLSYLLFVGSFLVFLIYSSETKLSPTANTVWLMVQFALGIWTYRDRRNNSKRLFYCRTCNTRLPF